MTWKPAFFYKSFRTRQEDAAQQQAILDAQENKAQKQALSYLQSVAKHVENVTNKINNLLRGTRLEEELQSLTQVRDDIVGSGQDLRELPNQLQLSVVHIAHLRAHPDTYLRDANTRTRMERQLWGALAGLQNLESLEEHLATLEKTTKALRVRVKRVKSEAGKLKAFRKHLEEAFNDYAMHSSVSRSGAVRSKIAASKARARRQPRYIKGVS